MESWWLSSTWASYWVVKSLWPLLGLMGSQIGSIWSIGWLCQTLAPICFIPTVFSICTCSIFLTLIFQVLEGGGWRSIVMKEYEFDHCWKTYSQFEYTGHVSLSKPRWIGFPLGTFPTQVGFHSWWWSTELTKNKHHLWHLLTKKQKEIYPNQTWRMR